MIIQRQPVLGSWWNPFDNTDSDAPAEYVNLEAGTGAYTTVIGGLQNFKRELVKAIPASQRYFPAQPASVVVAKISESFLGLMEAATGISTQLLTTEAHREQADRVVSQADASNRKFKRALRDTAGKYILQNANNKGNTPLYMPDFRSAIIVAIEDIIGGFYALNILAVPPGRLVQLIFFMTKSGLDMIEVMKRVADAVSDVVVSIVAPSPKTPLPPEPEPDSDSNTMLIAAGAVGISLIGWLLYRRMRSRRAAE